MAQRFQNGLQWDGMLSSYGLLGGKVMCRWLVEFLKVAGWSVVDKAVGTRWDNYIATGLTGETINFNTIELPSPGYAFSSADAGSYLTITGFAAPYQARDGIYMIQAYVGNVGTTYTLQLHKYSGPHSDCVPDGHADLHWSLWKVHANYMPADNDVIVLGGKGYTGAGLNVGAGTGDSIAMSGTDATLTDATANFQTTDIGKSITLANCSDPDNDGTFVITARGGPTQVTYVNVDGVNETSAFSWNISYDFHLHMKSRTVTNSGLPELILSPFASWNAGTHAWNDSRYTAVLTDPNWVNSNMITLFAEADVDHFNIYSVHEYDIVPRNSSCCQYTGWWHVGETTTYHPVFDPRPVVIATLRGNNFDRAQVGYGSGQNSAGYTARGLSYDATTTLAYYLNYFHCSTAADTNWTIYARRSVSTYSKKVWRAPLILESRTTGHMELRGKFKYVWCCSPGNRSMSAFGANKEWLHPQFGVAFKWNGAQNWYQRAFPSSC